MENHEHHKNHNTTNPFSHQHPAQPIIFADRAKQLQYFKQTVKNSAKLNPPAPLNYAILGTWGQGKTSLVYKLKEIALNELQNQIQCACIYFPLMPQYCQNWNIFTENFLKKVKTTTQATQNILPKIKKEIDKWEINLNMGIISAQRKTGEKQPQPPNLTDALQQLWEQHLQPSGVQIAFVMLDDLHYFPLKAEDSAYLNLRTTFQELVNRGCNYSLVVTAHSLLFSEIAELAEPIARFFTPFELKPFTFAEVKEAIDVRLKAVKNSTVIDDEVIQVITEKTNGHPYLVMFSMSELLMHTEEKEYVGLKDFQTAWPDIEYSFGRMIFAQKFQIATDKEKQLMIAIAKTQKEYVSPTEFKVFGSGVAELFSRLENKELLLKHERGKYGLFHPMFAEFLRHQQ
jgi:Cdc6-like AAA superfamily ATPase